MALVIGNTTSTTAAPNSTTQTISHNQDVGADGHLVVMVALQSSISQSVTGITYKGASMTLSESQTVSGWKWYTYDLDAPANGSNNIVITFSSAIFGSNVFSYIVSATGCSGVNVSFESAEAVPSTETITVSNNSYVLGNAFSTNGSGLTMTIDGTSVSPFDFDFAAGSHVFGGMSQQLSSGNIDIVADANGETIAQMPIEFVESGGVPPTSRRVIII